MSNEQRRADDRPWRPRVATLIVLGVIAFLAGRASEPYVEEALSGPPSEKPVPRPLPTDVVTFHDASHDVTCWRAGDRAISCLPDQWLSSARTGQN